MAIACRDLHSLDAPCPVPLHWLGAPGRAWDPSRRDDRIRAAMRSALAPGHDVGHVLVEAFKRTTRAASTGSSSADPHGAGAR
jgi:hypothetical protein